MIISPSCKLNECVDILIMPSLARDLKQKKFNIRRIKYYVNFELISLYSKPIGNYFTYGVWGN